MNYSHPNVITSTSHHYLLSNLLTEKMGKPSPTMTSKTLLMVLSWYGYLMLLSEQKKPLLNGYIWPKFRTVIGREAVGEGKKKTHIITFNSLL